jgi:iron complex outermembrane receptor protein
MNSRRERRGASRARFLASATLAGALGAASAVHAQDGMLEEVVVTAQKRAQNLQDVPISVSAITGDTLKANRVVSVLDISAVAPNVTVRPSIGGGTIPSFTTRGVVSYGVVPGSDKSVSLYLDGVYIGATSGSAFDLPDIERIEVLKGPQGTLFGRNATAGAVNIITRDPPGEFGVRQEFTYGNYDQFRSRTRIDLPAWGPLSATVNYVHSERRGDIRNTGAGQTWNRTGPRSGLGVQTSPKYLGDKNIESVFAAVKFEPNEAFSTTYKFDWVENRGTPDGTGLIGLNPAGLGPAGALIEAMIAFQPGGAGTVLAQPYLERPKALNNNFATANRYRAYGHALKTQIRLADNVTLLNTLSYRRSRTFAATQLDGLGGLVNVVPALGPVGAPFVLLTNSALAYARQWSDEVQLNADFDFVTVTAGALYFRQSTYQGSPKGMPNQHVLSVFPGGVIPPGNPTEPYNYAKSAALYAQGEFHLTSQLDLIAGYRITKDDKWGTFYSAAPTISFTYQKTKPAYMASVVYRPTDDVMVYGKYSSSFVSGGSVAGFAFDPETARSWEAGVKADLFDRRLRTNLALWTVKYKHLQQAATGIVIGRPELGIIVIDAGDAKAKGFDLEATLAPTQNLTLGGGLGYTDYTQTRVSPIYGTLDTYFAGLRPKWTASLWAQYETDPVFGEASLVIRADGNWHSKVRQNSQPFVNVIPAANFTPDILILNGRVALKGVRFGDFKGELAVWGRNLTNEKAPLFVLAVPFVASATYEPARTFGVDLTVDF